MQLAGLIIFYALQIYMWILVVRMIMSWIPMFSRGFQPRGGLAVIFEIVYTVTDPPVRFFERIVPPLRLGGISLSLGFMLLYVILIAAQRITLMIFW
ncbi:MULTISPECIES: YggT family protein [Acidipropionibacterium]|uniref:YggT family protein n=1 Tax=Acidipropionibacterium TaxID=1912215 RepID=UPI0004090F2D|nr:YggT family protein [Acidipropionibacterium thoenii]